MNRNSVAPRCAVLRGPIHAFCPIFRKHSGRPSRQTLAGKRGGTWRAGGAEPGRRARQTLAGRRGRVFLARRRGGLRPADKAGSGWPMSQTTALRCSVSPVRRSGLPARVAPRQVPDDSSGNSSPASRCCLRFAAENCASRPRGVFRNRELRFTTECRAPRTAVGPEATQMRFPAPLSEVVQRLGSAQAETRSKTAAMP